MVYRIVITPEQKHNDRVILTSAQQHYLQTVLRKTTGDRFIIMDGRGQSWLAQLEDNSAHLIEPIITSTELPLPITLITALPKASGYEEIVRCCTELGVNTFIPVISDRTILKPSSNRVERWRKIATEAAEQSERQIVPTITNPIKFTQAIEQAIQPQSDRYICVARGDLPTLSNCLTEVPKREIILATGCEGGWTPDEVEQAIQQGFQPVSLGKRILRAITAPIVAVTVVSVRLN